MISVQNHRQRLSGNNTYGKKIGGLLLAVMLHHTISFAQLFKSKKDKADFSYSIEDTSKIDASTFFEDSLYAPMELETKVLNITIILPLYIKPTLHELDSVFAKNKNYAMTQPVMGLELYHGLLFGLDSLSKNYPVEFNITLFDSENSNEKIKEIMASPAFYNSDLIIGPVYNEIMKPAAEKAKLYNIPIVFPLSPAENITQENPRFFKVNPGIQQHIKFIFDFVKENFSKQNILWLQQTADKEVAQFFSTMASEKLNYKTINFVNDKFYGKDSLLKKATIEPFLSKDVNNVIIVPSIDLEFAHKLSRNLSVIAKDFQITLIGMPVWNPENDLRLDYLEKLNVHFTQSANIPDSMFYESSFAQSFFQLFNYYPTANIIKGFDIAYFFGKILYKEGKDFHQKIENYKMPCYHTNFAFKPIYSRGSFSEETKFLYFENTELHIFKIEDLELKKVK